MEDSRTKTAAAFGLKLKTPREDYFGREAHLCEIDGCSNPPFIVVFYSNAYSFASITMV